MDEQAREACQAALEDFFGVPREEVHFEARIDFMAGWFECLQWIKKRATK